MNGRPTAEMGYAEEIGLRVVKFSELPDDAQRVWMASR